MKSNKLVESGSELATFRPSRRLAAAIAGLALLALGVSGYLAYIALTSSTVAGCSGGLFDCGHVLNSQWSRWFGIPVSVLAALTYVIMLASLQMAQAGSMESRRFNWHIVVTLGLTAGLAAIWFLYLQFLVLEHLCIYCLTAHCCGLLIAIMLLANLQLDLRATGTMGSLAMTGLAILILGQAIGPAPKTYTIEEYENQPVSIPIENPVEGFPSDEEMDIFSPPTEDDVTIDETLFLPPAEEDSSNNQLGSSSNQLGRVPWLGLPAISMTSALVYQQTDEGAAHASQQQQPSEQVQVTRKVRRLACIFNNKIKLDVTQWPLVGDPGAKFVFVEMFDYACPHCRKTHQQAIKGAQAQLNGQLAVLALPLPLNTNCNSAIEKTGHLFGESCELSKLAVAVWRVDRAKFSEFHNWMFTGDVSPNYATARNYAEQLVDKEKLAMEYESDVVAAFIKKHVQIYEMTGKGDVPKLMFPTTSVVGEFTSADSLVDMVQEQGLVLTQ
jgi:uncharacterized membrane protein/protein-disulfide isomerase